jgi:hypothetical protein
MEKVSVITEFRDAYRSELDASQQSALISWLAFTTTFSTVRGITHAIKAGKGPFRNLSVGGEHLHHYMWGIAMVSGVGAVAVRGTEELRRHPVTALSYGTGLALIVDEFALLLDLKDVYWAKQGRVSVDLAIIASSAAATYFAALPVLRKVVARRRREAVQEAN